MPASFSTACTRAASPTCASGTTRYALMLDEGGTVRRRRRGRAPRPSSTSTSPPPPATRGDVYREMQRREWREWRLDCALHNRHRAHGGDEPGRAAVPRACCRRSRDIDLSRGGVSVPRAARRPRRRRAGARDARGLRVGELGYEIHVPLRTRARRLGRTDAGRAAASASRPSASRRSACCGWRRATSSSAQDTDGLTNPFEAGLGWAVRMDKPFFVGQRSLRHSAAARRAPAAGGLRAATAPSAPLARMPSGDRRRRHRRPRHQRRPFADAGQHHRPGVCSTPRWRDRGHALAIRASDGPLHRGARGAHALLRSRRPTP